MKKGIITILSLITCVQLFAIKLDTGVLTNPDDSITPSKNTFKNDVAFVPKISDEKAFIESYMEEMKKGNKLMGFLAEDELAMIEGDNLTEKRFFLDHYEIISYDRRVAKIKTFTAKGTSLSCKVIELRYYKNMYGHYNLLPGKVQYFERKMGDITLKRTYINTWYSEKICN